MRLHNTMMIVFLSGTSAACSPYLYKQEIDSFAKGVNQLAEATRLSVRNENAFNATRHRWLWIDDRPELTLSENCPGSEATKPANADANRQTQTSARQTCGLLYSSAANLDKERLALPYDDAGRLASILKTLQSYARSLASVTNAADLDGLYAAQLELAGAVKGLGSLSTGSGNGPNFEAAGPLVGLLNFITTSVLNWRRYDTLQKGVTSTNPSIKDLGTELGKSLATIREKQLASLNATARRLRTTLNPDKEKADGRPANEKSSVSRRTALQSTVDSIERRLDEQSYSSRLDALQSTVDSLENLRSSNPKTAADEMVKAHEELANVLKNDTQRQEKAVIDATISFLEKAEAFKASMAALREH